MNTNLKIPKILVIAPNFLGDSVLSEIFFKNLKNFYKNSQIDVITKNNVKPIYELFPHVNNVFGYVDKSIIKTRKFIKKQNYNIIFLLKRSLSSALMTFNVKASQIIGFDTQFRKPFLTNPVKYIKGEKPEAFAFLDLLYNINIPISNFNLEMYEDINSKNKIIDLLNIDNENKKILIIAKSTRDDKEINSDVWIKIIDYLKKNKNVAIYFIGLEKEKEYYNNIAAKIVNNTYVYNFCGILNLKECISLVKKMDMVLGVDTGFCHVASAFNIPTLSIFGHTPINQWGLLGKKSINFSLNLDCSPCNNPNKCKKQHFCIKNITFLDLKPTIDKLLNTI